MFSFGWQFNYQNAHQKHRKKMNNNVANYSNRSILQLTVVNIMLNLKLNDFYLVKLITEINCTVS